MSPPKGTDSMNLSQKAAAGFNLTPWERSLLKLGQSLLVAFAVAAAPVVADALSSHGAVDWGATLHNALLLGSMAVASMVVKYFKAQGDSPLPTAPTPQPDEIPAGGPGIPPTTTPAAAALTSSDQAA